MGGGSYRRLMRCCPSVNVMSVLVHDFYGRNCQQPVHLTIDTELTDGTMGLKSYVSQAVMLAHRSLGSQFRETGLSVMPFEAEAVGDFLGNNSRRR
jgi:hypothetical protein